MDMEIPRASLSFPSLLFLPSTAQLHFDKGSTASSPNGGRSTALANPIFAQRHAKPDPRQVCGLA